MTLREFTALVRLFQACADPALRRRAAELVPELREWESENKNADASVYRSIFGDNR